MNGTVTAVQLSTPRRRTFLWSWLIWTAGFLAFPIAGVAGRAVADRVDSPTAALVAGFVAGAVIGAGQWLVSRGRLRPLPWIVATALGMGLGLLLGATVVGFRTSVADLAVMGALTGGMLGVAQALALPVQTRRRWWWAVAMPLLWALGWIVTTLAGIPVDEQFTIFGASGAVTFSALSGLLLHWLLPMRNAPTGTARVDAAVVGNTRAARHVTSSSALARSSRHAGRLASPRRDRADRQPLQLRARTR